MRFLVKKTPKKQNVDTENQECQDPDQNLVKNLSLPLPSMSLSPKTNLKTQRNPQIGSRKLNQTFTPNFELECTS